MNLQAFFHTHNIQQCIIAYSGGLDSHVLLQSVAKLRASLPHLQCRAIHINHQLQSTSDQWARHCEQVCQALAIPLQVVDVQLAQETGESIEALAREARYRVFSEQLRTNEYLLTAHHQQDQAETLLLNLIRGAGTEGLAAMPAVRPLGQGYLARPLLDYAQETLVTYAQAQGLVYINDPSNNDERFSRNFIRHQLLPLLKTRWPTVIKTLVRVTQWQQENRTLIQDLLAEKLPDAMGNKPNTLSIRYLQTQSLGLQKALIRFWLSKQGFAMPSAKKLQHILTDVLAARPDANPCVLWGDCEVRRYQHDLYALSPLPSCQARDIPQKQWDGQQAVIWGRYTLNPEAVVHWLPLAKQQGICFSIRSRQGGERLRIGKHSRLLKQYLQAQAVPPWERDLLPLVYMGAELIYIPGVYRNDSLFRL